MSVAARALGALLAIASPAAAAEAALDYVTALPLQSQPLSGRSVEDFVAELGFDSGSAPRWYALHWHAGKLEIMPFRGFTARDGPFDWARPEARQRFAEPDCGDERPVIVVRFVAQGDGERAIRLPDAPPPGTSLDSAIGEGWSRAFDLGGRRWTLRADFASGGQAGPLPGSLRLTVESPGEPTRVVLERHPGLVFREQAALWAGDLTGDGVPDFLLRRTLVTGEVDHLLSVSRADGTYTVAGSSIDPDDPSTGIASDVERADHEAWRHANSPRPYAVYRLPPPAPATYALAAETPVRGLEIYARPRPAGSAMLGLLSPGRTQSVPLTPGRKREITFAFAGETFRVFSELVATWQGPVRDPHYFPRLPFGLYGSGGGLMLSVSIEHRGTTQVLLVTQPPLDETPVRLSAGDLDGSGRLSLSIDWLPHFNNGMNLTWTRAAEPGRVMRRLSSFETRGC
jgi:hypothetical protein